MQVFMFVLELAGTVAFAISGAMTAIRRRLDLFGVLFLGVVTAVGGGVLRDLMIGVTPPRCFRDPVYLLVALGVALVCFLPFFKKPVAHHQKFFEMTLFAMDSLGLAAFTITGIQAGIEAQPQASPVLLVFVGLLTATGGGVLRDVLVGSTPYIFVKHVYATASVIGAVLFVVLEIFGLDHMISGIICIAVMVIIRCLAAYYHWNLPRAEEQILDSNR
ncbi:MAG: trimeric intracellular cation channel family protein [Oscillospiraceae bacterium]|nr:trimeric intracellular cation channel family protein [Oscillospiraceae bacterium]